MAVPGEEGSAIIDRPDDVATTIQPLRSSDGNTDRLALFDAARDGAARTDLVDAVDTRYDVAARYLSDLSDDLLMDEEVRGTRLYAPTAIGGRVADAIDTYREQVLAVDGGIDPDRYLAAAVHRLTPDRIRILDRAVTRDGIPATDIREMLDVDGDAARARARPLQEVDLLTADARDGIIYAYSDTGEAVLDALGQVDTGLAVDAFHTLRNGDSYRVLWDDDVDSMAALARDLDVSKRTAYNWRDGLQGSGHLDDEARPTRHGARFRDAFDPVTGDIRDVAAALQSEDRLAVFCNADQAARTDIAERTGMPLKRVQNLADDIEDRGLLDRVTDQGTVYHPGTYAGPVHRFLTAVDTALVDGAGDAPSPAELRWPDLPDGFDSPDGYEEFLVLAGVLGRDGDMETAADILDIHEETARSRAADLVAQGYLEREVDRSGAGRGSTSTYRVSQDLYETFADDIDDRTADAIDTDRDIRVTDTVRDPVRRYTGMVVDAITRRFPDRETAADAATLGAVLLHGGTVQDAAPHLDVAYQTALRRRDDLVDQGLLAVDGSGRATTYRLDLDFADDLQRYLEVFEPAATLGTGARTAHHLDRVTDRQAVPDAPLRDLVPDADLPEPFDIWPQLEEALVFARTASEDGTLATATDHLGRSRGVAKDRIATLEEKGVLRVDIDTNGAEFRFDRSVEPVIAEYADLYGIDMDAVRFTDLGDAWADDLFDDDRLADDLAAFATVAAEHGGVSTLARVEDIDMETAQERYDRLADAGYIARDGSGRKFLFDESVRPYITSVMDRLDTGEDDGTRHDPMDAIRFRDLEQMQANRERVAAAQDAADRDEADLPFRAYDGSSPGSGPTGPGTGGGPSRPEPDVVLDTIAFHRIADRDLDGLLDDIDTAVADTGTDPGAVNDRADLDGVRAARPTNTDSSIVTLPTGTGDNLQMDGDRYRRVEAKTGDLDDGFLLVTPGSRDSMTGFYEVDEVLGAVRDRETNV